MGKVEIVPYDPSWPSKFEAEAEKIKSVLGEHCITIHHIGSTAVPDLQAKPVIDMMPVVDNIFEIDGLIEEMEKLGYIARGECGMPFRRFFQKYDESGSFHVHMYEEENAEIEKHLIFRDYMREHESERLLYGNLKECLAEEYSDNTQAYCNKKAPFITILLDRIGFDGLTVVQPLLETEWEFVRKTRNQYYHHLHMPDPLKDTLEDPKHVHFILSQGVNIISYAHMLREPEKLLKITMMIVDKHHKQHQTYFQTLCERWIVHQS